jgi:topoisomerase-4 subunit B
MAGTTTNVAYNEDHIKSLEWHEHIRLRPGMYIGKLGDGTSPDDGIYILVKEIIDNSIDEFVMCKGQSIQITISEGWVTVRDYGRGIPLGKVVDCVSKINTGGKYDSSAFKKSVGLNGVGTKAVNALSEYFEIHSFRDGKVKKAHFEKGLLVQEEPLADSKEKTGVFVKFKPDASLFKNYEFLLPYLEKLCANYAYLNRGLTLYLNEKSFFSENGLADFLSANLGEDTLYPIVHLEDKDIEIAFTHTDKYGEDYYSFVNGQYTAQGGTHQSVFREAIAKTIRDFYNKAYEPVDIHQSIVASISVRIIEPVFESQTKTKLSANEIEPGGKSMRVFIGEFLREKLDNYLHRNLQVAKIIEEKIKNSERERKELQGIQKLAKDRAKKVNLHNKKLRDCRAHYNDAKGDKRNTTTLFITEGDSASGSITKSRDVNTQAVFSLKGKPLNCYGLTKRIVYENEEFNLIQAALNIENGIEQLRYNRIVLATDADVDGMHIRLLLMTFFLQFFPELVRRGHVYVLQTPLFRVRNKNKTSYCYSELEKKQALQKLGKASEIVRFKGLGEISPDEFKHFIGEDMRIDPVIISKDRIIQPLLDFYMGKNTNERQKFIIERLKVEA